MDIHEHLVEQAEKAIDAVFGDQSVSQGITRESLEGLVDYIQTMIDTLE